MNVQAITALLDRRHVIPGLFAADKASVLRELAARAAIAARLDAAMVAQALEERERLGSTATGGGIAIPHARIAGLAEPFAMFARLEPPIAFEAMDGKPVDLVFLLLTPAAVPGAHLAALAAISRRLRDPAAAVAIRAAANAKEIYAAIGG